MLDTVVLQSISNLQRETGYQTSEGPGEGYMWPARKSSGQGWSRRFEKEECHEVITNRACKSWILGWKNQMLTFLQVRHQETVLKERPRSTKKKV